MTRDPLPPVKVGLGPANHQPALRLIPIQNKTKKISRITRLGAREKTQMGGQKRVSIQERNTTPELEII